MSHTLPWSYLTICMCCEPNSGIHESRDIWSSPFLLWNHFLAYYFSLFFTHSKFYQGSLALELTGNPLIRCWLDNSPIQYYNIKIYFSTNNPTTTFLDIGRKECKPTIDHLYLWLSGHLSRVFLTFKAIACWNCWRCSTTYTTRFTTFSLKLMLDIIPFWADHYKTTSSSLFTLPLFSFFSLTFSFAFIYISFISLFAASINIWYAFMGAPYFIVRFLWYIDLDITVFITAFPHRTHSDLVSFQDECRGGR